MRNLIVALCFALPSLSFVNAYALGDQEKEVLAQGLKAASIALSSDNSWYDRGNHGRDRGRKDRDYRHDRDGWHDRDGRRPERYPYPTYPPRPPRPNGHAFCISNGEFGGFEKFAPYINGRVIGGYTSRQTCEHILNSTRAGLICSSNGEFGGFERFAVTDMRSGVLGGYTSISTCQRLVWSANRAYTCVSDGQFGGFERFYLFDRQSYRTVGGGTYLETCLNYIR